MDADLGSTYVDSTPAPFPTMRFASRDVIFSSRKVGDGPWVTSHYDVGLPHVDVVDALGIDNALPIFPTPLVTATIGSSEARVVVRQTSPLYVRRLRKRGYRHDGKAKFPFYGLWLESADLTEELRALVRLGCGLDRSTWELVGESESRRLGWSDPDLRGMESWLSQHPNLMRYARQEMEEALRLSSASRSPVHIAPRADGTWHSHQNIKEYGCGLLVVKAKGNFVSNYVPEQNGLACALQHLLFDTVLAPLAAEEYEVFGDRYAELRW